MGCDLHLSHMNLETVPCQSGHLSSGLPWRIFALMSVSSAIIGEMIRSSWHVDTCGHIAQACLQAAAGLWAINHVSWQRCQSETHQSGTYRLFSACWHGPQSLFSFRFMVIQTLSLLFFIIEWDCFIFLCVCQFFPLALSFQDYHRKYSIQHKFPRGASSPWFQ